MSSLSSTASNSSRRAQDDPEYRGSSESQEDQSQSAGSDDDSSSQSQDEDDDDEDGRGTAKIALKTTEKKRKRGEDQDGSGHEEEPVVDTLVLSHAERRRQRRREQQKQQDDRDASIRDRRIIAADTPSQSVPGPTKRQNSVWVGNLSYKTTAEDLKSFFAWAGDITRIHMPVKAPAGPGRKPENRGFAYVDFSTSEGRAAAIALSERPLIGRKLLIKDGEDFVGRPKLAGVGDGNSMSSTHSKTAQKILRAQKQPAGPTLFLGNLGFETTEADITDMLSAHRNATNRKRADSGANGKGETAQEVPSSTRTDPCIRKVRMGTFEDSGLCKGFAFVDFVSTQEATSALINPKNYLLNGRKLVVEYASPDAVRRGMPKARQIMKDRPRRNKGPTAARVTQDGDDAESREPPNKRPRPENASEVFKSRAKPGAVLASAKRESIAILPSENKKIKFD